MNNVHSEPTSRRSKIGTVLPGDTASGKANKLGELLLNKIQSCREEVRLDAERQWKFDTSLKSEFSHNFESYLAWRAAEAAGSVKILKGRVHD